MSSILIAVRVFLSYALPPYDDLIPSRLRANALGYNVEVLLPSVTRKQLTANTRKKIHISHAVIAFVADHAPADQIIAVNSELMEASLHSRPIVALVERQGLIQNIPEDKTVLFDRFNPSRHEARLFQGLSKIESDQKVKE